ncbi:MAG: TonB-dependent receptor plug domain-containing protein, partial [Muribaculaceae bacterium]|nr:TonB-dependent receptor plug domain-containing protein [Muribaculaceae bacterium]
IKVVLSENSTVLDEVVAVGYGTQKKVNMTGAVSSVKVGALEDRPINDVTTALAGLASGLSVRNTGGNTPGYAAADIKIRGNGTLNDASPLIVVDGVTGSSLGDVNPQDIESISILKDAASAAIYGSRAANGVILITTKQGQEGKVRLTYTGNLSIETVAKRFNIVTDYADFMEYQNQARINNGSAIQFPQEEIDKWRNDAGRNPRVYPNTDWQDHAYRDPTLVQTHNINVSGGSKSVRYNMTLGFVHNPGMLNCTEYKRYQMRSNVEVDITKWLTAGMNIYGYLEEVSPSSDNATQGGDAIWGGGGPFNTTPGMNLYDKETGTYGGVQSGYEAG